MGTYKAELVGSIISGKVSGELDIALVNEWLKKLQEQEASSTLNLNRFYDIREINGVNLNFDELVSVAQRRLGGYKSTEATRSAFWVSTPLNYGIARMYQSLNDGTPFKIGVFYKLDEVAEFLGVEEKVLEDLTL